MTHSPIQPSIRIATLAYALSVWVDGSTQLREPFSPDHTSLLSQPNTPTSNHPLVNWLVQHARTMDQSERTVLGITQVLTSILVLRGIGLRPLLPFLASPFILVPKSFKQAVFKWPPMLLTSIALSLLHESKRVLIILILKAWRRKNKLTGPVTVTGFIPSQVSTVSGENSSEPEDRECLICAGVGIDDRSVSSDDFSSSVHTPDALQQFCTTAPAIHLFHKDCFLRWQYEHVRQFGPPLVQIQYAALPNLPAHSPKDVMRAKLILKKARLDHIALGIQPQFLSLQPDAHSAFGPTTSVMTLHPPSSPPSDQVNTLATLQTSSPPCPACRSPVHLRFVLDHSELHKPAGNSSVVSAMRKGALLFGRHWSNYVSGKTLAFRLLSQLSFLLALLSMARSQKNRISTL